MRRASRLKDYRRTKDLEDFDDDLPHKFFSRGASIDSWRGSPPNGVTGELAAIVGDRHVAF
jgi:hypothetical protein